MFERFSDKGRTVVVRAQEEARAAGHKQIGAAHLLIALAASDATSGRVLGSFALTPERCREAVLARCPQGDASFSGHIPFTPRAKKVLELALRVSIRKQDGFIGTRHLLEAMTMEEEGTAAEVLRDACGSLEAVRAAIEQEVGVAVTGTEGWSPPGYELLRRVVRGPREARTPAATPDVPSCGGCHAPLFENIGVKRLDASSPDGETTPVRVFFCRACGTTFQINAADA